MASFIQFEAFGEPVTQGSTRAFLVRGRPIITHQKGPRLMSWRTLVADAAAKAMLGTEPMDGPFELHLTFTLPRPKSAPKKRLLPDRKPDLDKLCRGVFDSLRSIVYTDDARVCVLSAEKIYGAPAGVKVVAIQL